MKMFLILTALLLSLKGNNAAAGETQNKPQGTNGLYINITAGEITAEAGLCAVLPCSFSTAGGFEAKSVIWYKCQLQEKCNDVIFNSSQSHKVQGRMSLLEFNLTKSNCSLIINDLTESDSGYYQLRLNGIASKPEATVNVKVSPVLTQKPTVKVPALTEGQQTTLTCTAPGLCSGSDPNITWTWRRSAEDDSYIPGNITTTHGHNSSLTFTPSAKHHSTEVTCKVNFRGNTSTQETVTLNVTLSPKILNISSCERSVRSEVVTCVCISEGFPLPTIRWPMLEKHSKYSVITTVSDHTINSTVTLSGKHVNNTVECISKRGETRDRMILSVSETKPNQRDLFKMLLKTVQEPQVIFSFLIGLVLSASICCLAGLCRRKKTKTSANLYETLEMVTAQTVPLKNAEQQIEDNPAHEPEVTEGQGVEASGTSAPGGDVEAKQVEYSDLDFSVLTRQRPAGAEETQASTETEYAEIKRETTEDTQDNDGEAAEMEEVKSGEDEENKLCVVVEEEQGEAVSLYSNLDEINDI
ncbi:sialic acid-binding Ig-like lectin 9 [Sphaeramia orbicularis]|uniref:Sialic acid-binding Ig-like lectin 9 n=1 Tax=Sphaeramia orbicularis TaxID=375764 RepID=A0A673A2L8_9TELE|nr:sialic acid-binding Ig-like lectin 9 [Sphaeramia orbicularis]